MIFNVLHPDWMLEKMTEQEQTEVPAAFQCSIFPELSIALDDVFYRLLN